MKRSTRVLAALTALVVTGVGLALFLVLSDAGEVTVTHTEDARATATESDAPTAPAEAGGRRRAHQSGSCALFGQVQRADGGTPVVGQDVVLIDATQGETRVQTDAAGAFRFDGIADGGPYEVRVTAAKMADVRLPGIALDAREQRDLGTLLLDAAVPVTVRVRSMRDVAISAAEVSAYAAPQMTWNFDWSKAMAQLGQEPIAVAHAQTDGEGIATFDGLAAGTWSFVAVKDGFARSGRASVRLRAREPAEAITLHLGTGHTVSGRVIDGDGAPIAGALVLGSTDANPYDMGGAPLRARATTDEAGQYVLNSLAAGDIALWAARPGDIPAMQVMVRVPDVDHIDLTLRTGGTITGLVTDKASGEPIAGATVRAFGGAGVASAETDAEGRYSAQASGTGMGMSVQVTKDGYYQEQSPGGQAQLAVAAGQTLQHDVQLSLGAAMTGTVNGPSGPVAGARLMVVRMSPQRGFDQRQATADAQGAYRVTGLEEGTWYVMAMSSGLYTPGFTDNWWMAVQSGSAPENTKAEVVAGQDAQHDVTMIAGAAVSGRVETTEGEPVAGARVIVNSPMAWGANAGDGALSGADGTFVVDGVTPTAQVTITATKSGLISTGTAPIAVAEGDAPENVVIVMAKPAVVRGQVTLAGGEPPEDAYVMATVTPDQSNGPMYFDPSMYMTAGRRYPVKADGSYEVVLGAVSGQLAVTAGAPGYAMVSTDAVAMSANQAEYTVDVALGEGLSIDGRVTDKVTGVAIEGALVRVTPVNRNRGRRGAMMTEMGMVGFAEGGGSSGAVVALSDATGAFRIRGVSEGDYSVAAQADGYVGGSASARAPSGGTVVDVPLAPELEIRGRVRWPDGSPVAGVMVGASPETQGDGSGNMKFPMSGMMGGNGGVTTDSSGAFVVRGLAEGRYSMSVSNAWQGRMNMLPYDGPAVAAGSADVELVVREGMRISGEVVDDAGKPVAGAWIWAMPMKPEQGKAAANVNVQSDDKGSFELVGLSPMAEGYRLQANAQGGFGGGTHMPTTLENVQAGATGVRMVMSAGMSIEGTLVDADGHPMSNVWLSANPVQKPGDPPRNSGNAMVAAGKFNISGLAAGLYVLQAQTWGSGRSSQLVVNGGAEIAAGSKGLRLTATKGIVIAGTVVDASGQPLSGARVQARAGKRRASSAYTGPDGTFELTNLGDDATFDVTAVVNGRLPVTARGVAPGTESLRLVAETGVECSGRVLDADGSVLAGANLTFHAQVDGESLSQSGQANDDGTFRIGGFAEGVTYRAMAWVRTDNSARTVQVGEITGGASGVTLQATE